MSITARRVATEITITGDSQQETTESINGRIDQLIIESSTPGQTIDLILSTVLYGEEIYRNDGLFVDMIVNDLRPNVLPLGPIIIKIENPTNPSGTVNVTIIEKERES